MGKILFKVCGKAFWDPSPNLNQCLLTILVTLTCLKSEIQIKSLNYKKNRVMLELYLLGMGSMPNFAVLHCTSCYCLVDRVKWMKTFKYDKVANL